LIIFKSYRQWVFPMENKLKVLIVDDEDLARKRLCKLLSAYDNLSIVAQAENVNDAAEAISRHSPDVIFLDIQMPGGSGFELFSRCEVKAAVIFVTAYDEYALRAFEVNALDYLLKPIVEDRLTKSIERVRSLLAKKNNLISGNALRLDDRLAFQRADVIKFAFVHEISHLCSAGDYSEVFLKTGCSFLHNDSLKNWEIRLRELPFLRIHRQTIVNLRNAQRVQRTVNGYQLKMQSLKKPLPVARRRVKDLREFLLNS